MNTLEIGLFRIVPGFLLALGTVHYITHFQLIRRLELAHGQLWRSLGQPTILGALLTGGTAWSVWSTGKPSYVGWLWRRGYRDLDDRHVKFLGAQLTWQTWIALAVVFAWLSVAWLNGSIEAH